ncbi:MAG: OmpA family protein [Bacteroidetes bacterium]|nr:OmpA family protein [Bacteroidota bacterium]MBS1648092.1 OmpA family protein [Bacteroidota bacterium]
MKKILLSFSALFMLALSFGQTTSNWKKTPSLGLNFFLKDFVTPDLIGQRSLPIVLRDGTWNKFSNMSPGVSLTYLDGLSNYVDFAANLHASFTDYQYFNGTKEGQSKFLLEADANVRLKLLPDHYFLVPYVSGGLGVGMYGGTYFSTYVPVGIGFQFKLGEGNFIDLGWSYHLRISDKSNYNFQYSIGFISPLKEKKAAPVVVTPPPPPPVKQEPKDTDKDGIPDDVDKCPTVPGVAKYNGCPVPDTDGDGINDENDKCPTVPGVAKYNGCPVPDTDGDGINDENDKCPTVPGVARYQGCPVPDTDGDGVNDEEDKCPTEKGTVANHGCPELKDFGFDFNKIQFATGTAVLTKNATAELNKAVGILNEHKSLNISIEGYTDNTGKAAANVALSQKRADAVKAYLVKKGINADRLTATGYGDASPVGDNKTVKGRAENRRVEFKVKK